MKKLLFTLLIILMLPLSAQAQSDERCFPETGYCISGAIREYWERNGGLAVFGYPITERYEAYNGDWTGPMQYFERDRLEDHANEGLGVMAGRLGAQLLEMQGRPWETLPRDNAPRSGCRYFELTGQNLCGVFLRYWEQNGGLERFGYPISQATTEHTGEWVGTVQYFERRRMEHHPELAGTPYEVLLGLLGSTTTGLNNTCFELGPSLANTAWAYREELGCASAYFADAYVAYQPFERGAMFWIERLGSRYGNAIGILHTNPDGTMQWNVVNDTWYEGQPESGGETPPPGLYEPIRGFGKVWREVDGVRQALGWATAPEQGDGAEYYRFTKGALLRVRSSDTVYLIPFSAPTGSVRRIERVP
mgnify:FL=1